MGAEVHASDTEVAVRWHDRGMVFVMDQDGQVLAHHRPPADAIALESLGQAEDRDHAAFQAALAKIEDRLVAACRKRKLSQRTIDALVEAVRDGS